MRILLIGNFPPDGQLSMSRYAEWMRTMCLSRGHEVTLLKPGPFLCRMIRKPAWSMAGYIDKFLLFRGVLRAQARRHDLIHILDHSNAIYLKWLDTRKCLITCHDLLAIKSARGAIARHQTGVPGRVLQRWIESGLRRAKYVSCVSEKTASDFGEMFGGTGAWVEIIPNGLNWDYKEDRSITPELAKRFGSVRRHSFFLHVGNDSWYKNRMGVLKLFASLLKYQICAEMSLMMAGPPLKQEMESFADANGLRERIVSATGLSNADLRCLYSNAKALIFPSLQEGFGWPILEAQACGCPVITSNRSPMMDIAGRGAILIDPDDPASAAGTIASQMSHLEEMSRLGSENLKRFNFAEIADKYERFYDRIRQTALASHSPMAAGQRGISF